jgi:hypothetical protein
VSLLFQGGRAEGHFNPFGPILSLAGGALFMLPWIWLPLMLCGCQAWRRGPADPGRWLLLCLATPPIVFFTVVSLWSHVLFHWAAPGYLLLLPLLGDAIARRQGDSRDRRNIRRWLAATAAVILLVVAFVATEVRFNWLPAIVPLAKDPAIDAVDWNSLRRELARRGLLGRPGLVVAATRWLDAGKIDYALGGRGTVICLGDDPREYGIIAPVANYAGADVLIVAPRTSPAEIAARFGRLFDAIDTLPPASVLHRGRLALSLPLYLGHRLHPPAGFTAATGISAGSR